MSGHSAQLLSDRGVFVGVGDVLEVAPHRRWDGTVATGVLTADLFVEGLLVLVDVGSTDEAHEHGGRVLLWSGGLHNGR
jgi:hypothetical protein